MMLTRLTSLDATNNFTPIRALHSLRLRDAEVITRVVGATDNAWTVGTFDDYDGYLSIMIEPPLSKPEQRPTYMVWGKTGQLELIAVYGDDCQSVGSFGDVYGLAAELASRLLGVVLDAA